MSHCHYSLTRGKGTEVHYDIPALERHFLSRFVHGRPLFDLNTALVVTQQKYIHSSENFAIIRKNISQVSNIIEANIMHTVTLVLCIKKNYDLRYDHILIGIIHMKFMPIIPFSLFNAHMLWT